ncbi:hypothetical protein ADK67_23100 [Saccharothrix sp. NRRL B-16348]|nr:hypothetical protein ADK67_23100 [Saccharothrix sp. NRRL B-16348]
MIEAAELEAGGEPAWSAAFRSSPTPGDYVFDGYIRAPDRHGHRRSTRRMLGLKPDTHIFSEYRGYWPSWPR